MIERSRIAAEFVPPVVDNRHVQQSLLTYDGAKRRLWIGGQRCHHGATGALLTASAALGFAAARWHPVRTVVLAVTGSILMAHDWHDRSVWFKPGRQD
jgi:hypothetical protein